MTAVARWLCLLTLLLASACGPGEPADYRARDISWSRESEPGVYPFDLWRLAFGLVNDGRPTLVECVVEVRNADGKMLGGTVLGDLAFSGERSFDLSFGLPPRARPTRPAVWCQTVGTS